MPDVMEFRARLVRPEDVDDPLHDGDTLWLELDRGGSIHTPQPNRLKDVRAPEVAPLQLGGLESRDELRRWVAQWAAGKWPFWVVSYRTSTYRDVKSLERYVVEVWNRDRTSCLNADVQAYVAAHHYPAGN